MEHWWIAWQLSKIKQKDLLQEAARFRLLQSGNRRIDRSVRTVHRFRTSPQSRLVAICHTLGQRLIDWGKSLKHQTAIT